MVMLMDLGVSALLHQCCADNDCEANSDNHLQSLGKEQSDQPPSSGLNSTMPLSKYISCIESFSSIAKDFPAQVSLARTLNANHLHVLTLTFDHPVEAIRNTISSYISTSLTQQKKYWGRPVHIVWADDCWQWKMHKEPRVSCERLHRDMMDGVCLFRRRDPADSALMAFQSEALNYGVELMAPACSWEASTTILLRYQYSDFDLRL